MKASFEELYSQIQKCESVGAHGKASTLRAALWVLIEDAEPKIIPATRGRAPRLAEVQRAEHLFAPQLNFKRVRHVKH